jgi:hypothetical protein
MLGSRDILTADLFEIPQAPLPSGGSLNFDVQICHALSDVLKQCKNDRYQVGADMSRLLGREVSKNMLDAYTAESRDAYNFPLNYVAAFEVATESFALTQLLAAQRGCKLLVGEEALLAELGKIEREEQTLKARRHALKQYLGRKGQ